MEIQRINGRIISTKERDGVMKDIYQEIFELFKESIDQHKVNVLLMENRKEIENTLSIIDKAEDLF